MHDLAASTQNISLRLQESLETTAAVNVDNTLTSKAEQQHKENRQSVDEQNFQSEILEALLSNINQIRLMDNVLQSIAETSHHTSKMGESMFNNPCSLIHSDNLEADEKTMHV